MMNIKKGIPIKKILLILICNTLLFSNERFDLSMIKFGSISYHTKTKMRIYKNKKTAFNLPIEISSHTEAIKQIQKGYIRKSTFNITFTAIKTNKMNMNTQRITTYDMDYKLTKLTEDIDRNGEKQTITCTPRREALPQQNDKKEIGYKTDVILLDCDDGNSMKMQSQLQANQTTGLANFTTKKNFMMKHNGINYKIEETTKTTIDTNGTIHKITAKVKVENLFSLRYTADDIEQSK